VEVTNAAGQQVAVLQGGNAAGINTVVWSMRPQAAGRGSTALTTGGGAPGPGGGRGRGNVMEQLAPLGEYTITLDLGTSKLTQKARVTKTQGWSLAPSPQIIR
jgi:hypothetical protein